MALRDNILEELIPYFDKDKRYYLLICDQGFGKVDSLRNTFPKRILNCGIAEQATVGIASGMAESGLIPIVFSIATFLCFRALEQIRNDVVLRRQNVKLIGNGCDDFFMPLGDCHWCKQDDKKLMKIIGMPVYTKLTDLLTNDTGGYLRC